MLDVTIFLRGVCRWEFFFLSVFTQLLLVALKNLRMEGDPCSFRELSQLFLLKTHIHKLKCLKRVTMDNGSHNRVLHFANTFKLPISLKPSVLLVFQASRDDFFREACADVDSSYTGNFELYCNLA